MKRCKRVRGWTDYPMEELGDIAGKRAPIRHIFVLGYDGDKYATVLTESGHIESIKACYIYRKAGRLDEVPNINVRKLERMICIKGFL